jgi:hypothetical protein
MTKPYTGLMRFAGIRSCNARLPAIHGGCFALRHPAAGGGTAPESVRANVIARSNLALYPSIERDLIRQLDVKLLCNWTNAYCTNRRIFIMQLDAVFDTRYHHNLLISMVL